MSKRTGLRYPEELKAEATQLVRSCTEKPYETVRKASEASLA
jgi:hypothetical protein